MKKVILILCVLTGIIACKKQSKTTDKISVETEENELLTMTGDFIYYADAAVLQTSNEIYGVIIDEKMHELNSKIEPYKVDDTDMITVTVKVNRFKKPENEEGWPFQVKIEEIVNVEKQDTTKQDIIKLVK